MTCKKLSDEQVIVPGEPICDFNQEEPNGMNFFIVPGAMVNRNPVVNMPFSFKRPELGNGPVPHYGLRSWNQETVPWLPNEWDDIPIFMSTYGGDLVMWQAHVPYKFVSGEEDQFHSNAERYFETTVQTLPDTWASDYDVSEGVIRFIMVGKAGLCRGEFEQAQAAAGGAPVFPNYDDLFGLMNGQNVTKNETTDMSDAPSTNLRVITTIQVVVSCLALFFLN